MEELNLIEQALDKATLKGVFNLKEALTVGNNFYNILPYIEMLQKNNKDSLKKIEILNKKLQKQNN